MITLDPDFECYQILTVADRDHFTFQYDEEPGQLHETEATGPEERDNQRGAHQRQVKIPTRRAGNQVVKRNPQPSVSAVQKVGSFEDRFLLAVWAGPLFTAYRDFGSRKDVEWVAVGLLNQRRVNRCVSECVAAFGTCRYPPCHVGTCQDGKMFEEREKTAAKNVY